MKKILLMSALVASVAFAAGPNPQAQQVLDKVQSAFNQHDATKLSQLFAPDATLVLPSGKTAHGQAAILTELKNQMNTVFKDSHSTFKQEGTRPIHTDALWMDAIHDVTNAQKPDGTKGPMTFHLTALLTKQPNGQWMISEARPYVYEQAAAMGTGGAGDAGTGGAGDAGR